MRSAEERLQERVDLDGDEANSGESRYWLLPGLFCVLFGVALIANTQPAGDGTWFWYAAFFHQGKKLYSGMHLALQPLYVLETDLWTRIAGQGWLISKIPALVHLLGLVSALVLLLRESSWPNWQKSLLLVGSFLVSIQFVAYRFDDYHVLADAFVLYSLLLLLRVRKTKDSAGQLWLAAMLGVLSGLTAMTRINDGAGLLVATGICLLVLVRARRVLTIAVFSAATAVTCLAVIELTGDTPRAWALNSILRAAGSKGGTGSILLYPLLLLRNCLSQLRHEGWALLFLLVVAVLCPLLAGRWKRGPGTLILWQIVCAGVLLAIPQVRHRIETVDGGVNVAIAAGLDLMASGVIFWIVMRGIRTRMVDGVGAWDRQEMLLLIPLSQLASGSTSSAGHPQALYVPVAMMLLLAAIVSPTILEGRIARAIFLSVVVIMALSVTYEKVASPYSWNSFQSEPMFEGRMLYHHPHFGSMVVDRDLAALMEPICRDVQQPGSAGELLSLPFPYANYFCDTPPWHGYVQTFFDTTSKQTIDDLMVELETKPPQWILYQRQLQNLGMHEKIFNHRRPLPERALDELIVREVSSGRWKVVEEKHYGPGEGWFLIQTRP